MISLAAIIGGPLGAARVGAGIVAGLALFAAYDAVIDDPHIYQLAEKDCTIRTQQRAQEAADAVRLEFQKSDQAAQDAYERDLQKSTERYVVTLNDMKQEIADYEAQLAGEGRSCLLTDGDFVRLRGGLPP